MLIIFPHLKSCISCEIYTRRYGTQVYTRYDTCRKYKRQVELLLSVESVYWCFRLYSIVKQQTEFVVRCSIPGTYYSPNTRLKVGFELSGIRTSIAGEGELSLIRRFTDPNIIRYPFNII